MKLVKLIPCFIFVLMVFGSGFAATQTSPIPLPERTLIVYTANIPASLEVADYYSTKRGIPAANKCAITPTRNDSIDFYNYEINVRKPIQNCLNALGKERILYIVFAYETPYKILNVPTGSILETRAVDQFVANIWSENIPDIFEITNHPYFAGIQSQGNIYPPFVSLADYRNQPATELIYSVWRLDGATIDLAKGLVDKSLQAEANGLTGQACFDRRLGAIDTLEDSSASAGNWDLFRAAEFARRIGMTVTEDKQEAEFGTAPAPLRCENVALYSGWYSYNNYNDAFSWATGAIGFHLDSASAVDPRGGANWAANALKQGITVTSGAINEPYLEGLPHPDGVFRNLFEGANVGDAFLRNTAFLNWMIINIGDPLYRPFPGGRPPYGPSALLLQNTLSLDSTFVVGGKQGTGKFNLAIPAPIGGTEVRLTSSLPEYAIVTDTLRIPAGARSAEFTITTKEATVYQPAIISATTTSGTVANTLTVAPLLSLVSFSPAVVSADTLKTGTIFLNDYAPVGGVTISLTSDNPSVVTVPPTVFVEAGQFKATFTVFSGVVVEDTAVSITASYNGAKEVATLLIMPTTRRIVGSRKVNRN